MGSTLKEHGARHGVLEAVPGLQTEVGRTAQPGERDPAGQGGFYLQMQEAVADGRVEWNHLSRVPHSSIPFACVGNFGSQG